MLPIATSMPYRLQIPRRGPLREPLLPLRWLNTFSNFCSSGEEVQRLPDRKTPDQER